LIASNEDRSAARVNLAQIKEATRLALSIGPLCRIGARWGAAGEQAYLQANGSSPFSQPNEPIAELAGPADERMHKSMFSANVQGPERRNVIAAIIAMAIVVLVLWLFVFLLHH
jgi:hypothetical protein